MKKPPERAGVKGAASGRGEASPLTPARSPTLSAPGQAKAWPGCPTASAGFGAAPQGLET